MTGGRNVGARERRMARCSLARAKTRQSCVCAARRLCESQRRLAAQTQDCLVLALANEQRAILLSLAPTFRPPVIKPPLEPHAAPHHSAPRAPPPPDDTRTP